jgi:DNA-directed RNA polymerase specialized sigma24 family protein
MLVKTTGRGGHYRPGYHFGIVNLIDRLRTSSDGVTREKILTDLLTVECHETIRATLSRRRAVIHPDDVEDLRSQVVLRLLKRLTSLSASEPIDSFPDYVAVVTYHVVDDYVRSRDPQRALMANRLKYVLTRNPAFALWQAGPELVCGLAGWKGSHPAPLDVASTMDCDRIDDSLASLFRETGRALPFQAVVTLFVRSRAPEVVDSTDEDASKRVESRQLLGRLWKEILDLPSRQRVALLLNLRDSGLPQFILCGIATFDAVASAIGWSAETLASSWNELPFDDARIAKLLGATPQQVINLRKSARARMERRMVKW